MDWIQRVHTRHKTISKLYYRAYVHGNPLQPTKIAYSVTDTLSKYAEKITKPDMTRALEQDMDKIANGSYTDLSFLRIHWNS